MVATLVHNTPCGIDIQKEVEKITRIAPKFCNGQELDFLPSSGRLSYYHIIWGAKESIYKAYGRKKLDFKKNIIIEPFEFDGQSTTFDARLITDQKTIMFQVTCFTYINYYLVYALQQ